MRALIVDDSKMVRNILERILHELHFDVTLAGDGKEAFGSLESAGKPDVALVDWDMPVMDGLAFLQAVRADPRFRDLPILMVTTRAMQHQVVQALEAGVNEYLMKPFTKEAIAEKLAILGFSCQESGVRSQESGARSQESDRKATSSLTPDPYPLTPVSPIRVLIVDDSALVRRLLTAVLSSAGDIVVADTASDGQIGLDKLSQVRPDVVLLDLEMPNLNGPEMLKALRSTHPHLPVIVFSSLALPGAVATVNALLLGADDYVPKPAELGDFQTAKKCIADDLIPKIRHLARRFAKRKAASGVGSQESGIKFQKSAVTAVASQSKGAPTRPVVEIIAIAASTGGPVALANLLPAFAVGCQVPIVIVQHMPPLFTAHLATRLASLGHFPTHEAADGDELLPGHVWIAPGGRHMVLKRRGNTVTVRTNQDPLVNSCRPSADVLFASVVEAYGPGTLAVVLTGMGRDGTEGCRAVCTAGGQVVVQDEASSVVWGMPGNVVDAGLAERVLPLDELGREIARRIRS